MEKRVNNKILLFEKKISSLVRDIIKESEQIDNKKINYISTVFNLLDKNLSRMDKPKPLRLSMYKKILEKYSINDVANSISLYQLYKDNANKNVNWKDVLEKYFSELNTEPIYALMKWMELSLRNNIYRKNLKTDFDIEIKSIEGHGSEEISDGNNYTNIEVEIKFIHNRKRYTVSFDVYGTFYYDSGDAGDRITPAGGGEVEDESIDIDSDKIYMIDEDDNETEIDFKSIPKLEDTIASFLTNIYTPENTDIFPLT